MSQVVGEDLITGLGFIGLEPGRLYRMRRGPKAVMVTVSGNPAILEHSISRKLKGLKLCGKSTQASTTGAQILPLVETGPVTVYGLTWQTKDSIVVLHGESNEGANASTDYYIVGDAGKYYDAGFPIGTIKVSAYGLPKGISFYVVQNTGSNAGVVSLLVGTNGNTAIVGQFEHVAGATYRIMLRRNSYGTYNANIKIMFNAGAVALPWEPYTGGCTSPNPDYPQEIMSAGGSGKVVVTVRGTNLFDYKEFFQNYKTTSGSSVGRMPIKVRPNTDYYVSTSLLVTETSAKVFCVSGNNIEFNPSTNSNGILPGKVLKVTSDANGYITIGIYVKGAYAVTEKDFETAFVKVEEKQSLSILTPNGLPGIPVDADGNYTDGTGQQWICDEVDFTRKVYVQRCVKMVLNGTESWKSEISGNIQRFLYVTPYQFADYTRKKALVSHFYFLKSGGERGAGFVYMKNIFLYPVAAGETMSVEDFTSWLKENPVTVVGPLYKPKEIPLTDEQMKAYESVCTYTGTTTVETQEDVSYMEVSYERR